MCSITLPTDKLVLLPLMLSVTLQLEKALRSARHAVDVADESVFDSMSQRKHDGAVAQARALAAVAQGVAVSQKLSAVHTALRARENETARYLYCA